MRSPGLVCRYALIIASVWFVSFAVSDLSRGRLGVSLEVPVASAAYAKGGHGHGHGHGHQNGSWSSFWTNLWNSFWNNLQSGPPTGHTGYQHSGQPHKVPEPSTAVLFGLGMAGVYAHRRRSKR